MQEDDTNPGLSGACLWWMFFCIIVSIALTSYLVYAVYFSRFNIYGDQGFYCDEHVKQDWKLGKFFKEGPLNVSSDQFMNRYKR